MWRGLFCESCGTTYHSLLDVRYNEGRLLKLEKHMWRGPFCESCGTIYHSLLDVKYNEGRLVEIC